MPPRRSSRSRASVEPVTRTEIAVPKRKRGSQVPDDTPEEKENRVKPPSRGTRRSSVVKTENLDAPAKARPSTRAKVSLPELPESDEDEDVPPAKKPRPSLGADQDGEDEEPQHATDTRRRKQGAPAKRTSTRSKQSRRSSPGEELSAPVVLSDDNEDEDESKPRKGASKSKPPRRQARSEPLSDTQMDTSDRNNDASKAEEETEASKHDEASEDDHENGSAPDSAEVPSDEEKEEVSLLEPQPIPSSQPQVVEEEPQGPKPRLVIHKLALVNFKSYAGRQVIGPFHKSFSAIVGPNGSGKSNTIDALLFVFGYRATKMRQGKLSELIHNSAMYPDLDECSVEIYFREIIDLPGPEDFEVVPDSQLVVARHAYKNNGSKYTINGKSSSYTEVQTLLKGRGIDLDHKRFLILQGEVESIAQMKPKGTEHDDGLLEYLEDIIGTSKYKEPIEQALVEVERLQEERGEKLNRLRIVEKERNALEGKRQEAMNYLRLHNEHVRAQSRLLQWYLWKCLDGDEELRKSIAKLKADLAELVERNKDDITHYNMLTEHYAERERAYEGVRAAAAEATKDLAKQEKEEVSLSERRKHAQSKAKKLKKTLQEDENAKAVTERLIEESADKKASAEAKLEEHNRNLATEEKELEKIQESLRDKTQVFHDQIEVKQKELQPWRARINSKQAEIDVATGERDALVKKAEEIKRTHKEAQETLSQLHADQASKEEEIQTLRSQKTQSERDASRHRKAVQDLQGKVDELRKKSSSARSKVDEAKASQAASTSQNRVVDGLSRLASQGRIQGFHGRLGSLGTIDDKYDVAISTACGALNNIVVDTVDQGQACIEYLRAQNLGRASFMILEKVANAPGMAPINTPEGVPRLFDLVRPKDPRFAPAFYKVLRDTLVATDLNQANRIAYGQKRYRVVTLEGGLIDLSGTMSGGGNQKMRGLMSSKFTAEAVRPETLRQYEQDSEAAAQQLDAAIRDLRNAETELERISAIIPRLTMDIEKLELDVANSKRRITDAEKRVQDLKAQSRPDAGDLTRIGQLDQEISSSTEELESLQEKSSKIEKAIGELEKKILDIGGSRLLAQKSKVEGLKLHIDLANEDITKAEVTSTKAKKDLVKYQSSLSTSATALEEVDSELKELDEELGVRGAYVRELKKQVDDAQAAAENSKEDLESLKTELDEKEEIIQAFKQEKMEIDQKLSEEQAQFKENDAAIKNYTAKHKALVLEHVDDDDDDDDEEEEEGEDEAATEGRDADGAEVKEEPGQDKPSRGRRRTRTPSNVLPAIPKSELQHFQHRQLIADQELLDERLKKAKPNPGVLEEYREREAEYLRRAKDLEDITTQRDKQKQMHDGLCKQRLEEFMAGFTLISLKLKEMYQMITLGGNAELELVDSMDPFSEGIIFSVMPPKKSWKNISHLSGGEKTLSSLALVFALHVFKPTPLYFMDEIDAALDFRNVSIIANYIKDRTKNAQFIIISLRNDMFELSHRLIGIYKTSNATRSISVDNHALSNLPTPAPTTL
ncbi:RecF/RecN/SMC protein [Pleurotus eryngii]|uniref:Structural maintenance of chromosomes protein n=1 Tax=Pleurotus eryngii TaxID=5323 RepID=A0A9P5ZKI4_PLEER|nr:RecF/RecN/SMC protein [Pleurotus eryngii]